MPMRTLLMVAALGLVGLAGSAAADPILDLVYQNVQGAAACSNGTFTGDLGATVVYGEHDTLPTVTLTSPTPSPPAEPVGCLALPG